MTSLSELTDIIKVLNHHSTNYEISLLQKKLNQVEFEYPDQPAIAPLLKMMQTLARYLDSRKDKAHPETIPLLLSIAEQFKRITDRANFHPDTHKDEIHKIVSGEIQKYKALQYKINSKPMVTDADLNKLKTVILTLDWEISDHSLRHFEKVVNEFLSAYQLNKIHSNLLKIIQSLGRYIGSHKANAHPDAISFLRSVFDDFEKIIQAPGMAFQNKKEILEKNIYQFYELKTRILKEKTKTKPGMDISEEEYLPPALSHIKTASKFSSGDVIPIPVLSEPGESDFKNDQYDTDNIKPALSDKKNPYSTPRDVMGDLFSLKESPADELLDAIHLMDVHGPNQGRASHIQNPNADSPSSGIKLFTPQLKNNEPIPEIENRLDEFFNLETPTETPDRSVPAVDQTVELFARPEENNKTQGIVPFQYEDEAVEQKDLDHDVQIPGNARVHDILDRLKTRIRTLDDLGTEPDLSSIKKDIFTLKNLWLDDPEKKCLVELLISTLWFIENQTRAHQPEKGDHSKENPVPESLEEKLVGIFARIKAMFFS